MRWYQVNSEELDGITDVLLETLKELNGALESARLAGLPRQYEMLTFRLKKVQAAIDYLPEIRKREE